MSEQKRAHALVSLGQFGARTRPMSGEMRDAVLVIGVGRVGLHAVARVREMLQASLPRRELQANVRLLAIARRRSLREEVVLPREERLMLDMEAIAWSDVPGRYAQMGVARWWPHSPRLREALDDLWLVRAYNRLLLYDNAALISETLFKLVRWLREVGTGSSRDVRRRILVLGSLAEPEGSGMIFDVVARLRALCGDQPVALDGVFSLRAPPDPRDPEHVLAMANVYATLRELDAWTLHPGTYRSTLPVIGHTLPHAAPRRALDLIVLADDAASESAEAPENMLAEYAVTAIAASMLPAGQASPLPHPVETAANLDRFAGYSVLGVSKLALPTRAAMDLAAVSLAQIVLQAAKTATVTAPVTEWADGMMVHARATLLEVDVLRTPQVGERLREWSYTLSAAGLTRQQEMRAARGESARMLDLVMAELRRLERESVGEASIAQGAVSAMPDSLRSRIDTLLGKRLSALHETLLAAPLELAYAQGRGLVWTVAALEALERMVRAELSEMEKAILEADAGQQVSRTALLEVAGQVDARGGGRFGGRKTLAASLDARAEEALHAQAVLIAAQARLDIWRELHQRIGALVAAVREAIPLVDQTSETLRAFEATCRRAMEQAAHQPPEFPAGVLVDLGWFSAGVQHVTTFTERAPHELLTLVYHTWGGGGVPSERRLSRFLRDILAAARNALASTFAFDDLHTFVQRNANGPHVSEALARLPGAATPALVPDTDGQHPAPARYEIVREAPGPFSAVGLPQDNVTRAFMPSPDPDEVVVLRVLHGVMAESLAPLRETYRRAYDRAGAEGMQLHIDRRWDSVMADLVHTSARREISVIWENLLDAVRHDPHAVNRPLDALVRAFAVALDVVDAAVVPRTAADMRLVVYKLRPFRLKLPPPNCAVLFLYSNRSVEEVSSDILRALTPLPLEEQFVFVVNITGRTDFDALCEPLRRVDYTVVELDEAAVKHLIGARLPTRALSDLVLEKVNLTTVSPFYTRGPVPEHMFFGREREINEVRSKLRTHSVALIGGRRIGKTSTLQRILNLLKPAESDYVPFYLDCHGATNYRSFFWLINRRWEVDIPQEAAPFQFEIVIASLRQRHPGKNIAILFDEVDSLLRYDRQEDNQETLFRTFRSLSNEKRCQFVFSGEKWLMRAMSDPYSALFNFTQDVRLEPLPPKVVHRLVAEPFEMLNVWVEESEQLIARVYEISAGHPNIVQMICQAMVEELDREGQNASLLTIEHLDRATSRRTLQEQIIQTIWGQMNPLARLVTLTWPEGERFLTLADVETLLAAIDVRHIPPEQLERTAKDLELYCFVRPRENDRLELIPMAFPAILDFMTDKRRQIEIVRRYYETDPQAAL